MTTTHGTTGQLSADQQRFVAGVANGTGLNPLVVASWVAAENYWGRPGPEVGYNFLNIGPGRRYDGVDQAVSSTVNLLSNSAHYQGIRASTGLDGASQVKAIAASPWDAGHYGGDGSNLLNVYKSLVGNTAASSSVTADLASSLTSPKDWLTNPTGQLAQVFGLDKLAEQVLVAGLGLVFVIAAFALIAMGLNKLSNGGVRKTFDTVSTLGGAAAVVL